MSLTRRFIKVDIRFEIIQSKRVVFNDPDFPILIYADVTAPKYKSLIEFNAANIYYVITDEFYGIIKDNNIITIYEHKSGLWPWFTLGGQATPRYDSSGNQYIIYQSDFTPAVPYLNDAAIYDNQEKSIMTSSSFPLRFSPGVACESCKGHKVVYDPLSEEETTCKSCNGTGFKLSFSPLGIYNVVQPPAIVTADSDKNVFQDPIKYYSPDPAIVQINNEKAKQALEKAEQVLNINRSLNAAQSGIAKQLDREPEFIEVAKISNAVYGHFKHTLEVIQALRFMDTTSPVTVNEPVSFELKTEVEMMAEFAESQKGMPDAIRYESYIRLVEQRYAQDKIARKISEICVDYTILILYTTTEINERLASGTILKADAVKAQYVFQVVSDLFFSNQIDIFQDEFLSIRAKIDAAMEPIINSLGVVNIPELEDLDENDDPEL